MQLAPFCQLVMQADRLAGRSNCEIAGGRRQGERRGDLRSRERFLELLSPVMPRKALVHEVLVHNAPSLQQGALGVEYVWIGGGGESAQTVKQWIITLYQISGSVS